MNTGMDEVVNPKLDAAHHERVPVEVEIEMIGGWGG